MNIKTKIAVTIAAALTLMGGVVGGAAAAANAFITQAVPSGDTIQSGCVIRFLEADGGMPSIHANGAHRCAGVESVGIDSAGRVEVVQSVKGASTNVILYAVCQTDETIGGKRGIICGATGGTDDTSFGLYDTRLGRALDLRKADDRKRVMGDTANLWVGWVHAPVGGVK